MASTPPYITDAGAPAQGALLALNPRGATPPVDAYVNGDDIIRIRAWNATANLTIQVVMRQLLPDGSIHTSEWDMVPTSDRVVNSFSFSLAEGFILSLSCRTQSGAVPVEAFAQITLMRASASTNLHSMVLTQGWLSLQDYLTWPGGVWHSSLSGPGIIRSITGTTPGAGAEISETVPAHTIWRLKAFLFKFTSSATAGNRQPHLVIDDGANALIDSPALTVQAASLTQTYLTGDDAFSVQLTDHVLWLQSVSDLRLLAGFRLRTVTSGLLAGDQYTAPQYLVEEWFYQ